jgi:U4/U6.U5 tri-snRNP component SNU23
MADSKQQGAYATKAADTDFRRKWDKEEYAEKARKKDEEERLRMQENEERQKQGTSLSLSVSLPTSLPPRIHR